jgi:hypothetical protein
MSLQVPVHSKSLLAFVPLSGLFLYKEFPTFKDFTTLEQLQGAVAFEEVKELLCELPYLGYYKDFELLLCSSCGTAVNPSYYKGHLAKHLVGIRG